MMSHNVPTSFGTGSRGQLKEKDAKIENEIKEEQNILRLEDIKHFLECFPVLFVYTMSLMRTITSAPPDQFRTLPTPNL